MHTMQKTIEIDQRSGFCFGVTRAISKAEEELACGHTLYCLGDIVHNGREVERLAARGLITVDHEQFARLHNVSALLRAHGEPPATYQLAQANHIKIIDATCPVVLHLQERIKHEYDADPEHRGQIVIYGKNGHAEVLGLVGQTEGTAIVVETLADVAALDFGRDITLYSQTTKSLEGFREIVDYIQTHMPPRPPSVSTIPFVGRWPTACRTSASLLRSTTSCCLCAGRRAATAVRCFTSVSA